MNEIDGKPAASLRFTDLIAAAGVTCEKVLGIRYERVPCRLFPRRADLPILFVAAQGDAIGCRFGSAVRHAATGMVPG